MSNSRILSSFAFLSFAAVLSGCSADAEPSNGSAPSLDSVSLDRSEIEVGRIEQLVLTLDYADADGDVQKVGEQVTVRGGTTNPQKLLDLPEAKGQKQGRQQLALQLGAPSAGTVDIEFWLVDAKGNTSARVKKTVTAK